MAELTQQHTDEEILAELKREIAWIIERCRSLGATHAADFMTNNQEAVLKIALLARKEPKQREMPSPFIYAMQ